MNKTTNQAERIKVFRKDLQDFLIDLETHNNYRARLVIPKALYKGLVWGMFWSATRILGPDDRDTLRLLKKFTALSRLNGKQIRRLRGLLRRILQRDPSSGGYVLTADFEAMEALYRSEEYRSL